VPFLQTLLRIQKGECVLQLPRYGFVARNLRPIKARAQAFDLIIDFAPALI
jgi:hypothetical protein